VSFSEIERVADKQLSVIGMPRTVPLLNWHVRREVRRRSVRCMRHRQDEGGQLGRHPRNRTLSSRNSAGNSNSKPLHVRLKRGALQAQHNGGSIRTGNYPVGLLKRG
jgi:hypothetical protein